MISHLISALYPTINRVAHKFEVYPSIILFCNLPINYNTK